jgi:hypothetical protein
LDLVIRRSLENALGAMADSAVDTSPVQIGWLFPDDSTLEELVEPAKQSGRSDQALTRDCEGETRSVPLYEADPSETLLAALRNAFPGFNGTAGWWREVEEEIKKRHRLRDESGYGFFRSQYPKLTSDDLLRILIDDEWIKPKARRGRPTRTVDGLNVHQYLMVEAMKDPSITTLSPKKLEDYVPFSENTIRGSWVWTGWRDAALAAEAERAERLRAEDESSALPQSGRGKKSVLGRERLSPKELKLKRDGDRLLAEASKAAPRPDGPQ